MIYYREVNKDSYNDLFDMAEDFTDSEITKLISYFGKYKVNVNRYVIDSELIGDNKELRSVNVAILDKKIENAKRNRIVFIDKKKDDYFMINIIAPKTDDYYECDQFDGLIKCLDDIC